MKLKYILLIFTVGFLLTGCKSNNQSTAIISTSEDSTQTSTSTSSSATDSTTNASSSIDANAAYIVSILNVGEQGAKGTATILDYCGCGKIMGHEDMNDTGNCYTITFIDNNENKYITTIGYDGYIGYIKDIEGNYLYAPTE